MKKRMLKDNSQPHPFEKVAEIFAIQPKIKLFDWLHCLPISNVDSLDMDREATTERKS